jgi:hypothetical protein
MSWSEFLAEQKMELGKLYVPYLALGMFCRFSFSPTPGHCEISVWMDVG